MVAGRPRRAAVSVGRRGRAPNPRAVWALRPARPVTGSLAGVSAKVKSTLPAAGSRSGLTGRRRPGLCGRAGSAGPLRGPSATCRPLRGFGQADFVGGSPALPAFGRRCLRSQLSSPPVRFARPFLGRPGSHVLAIPCRLPSPLQPGRATPADRNQHQRRQSAHPPTPPPGFSLWTPFPRRPPSSAQVESPEGKPIGRRNGLGECRQPTGPGLSRQRRAAARTPDSRACFGTGAPRTPDSDAAGRSRRLEPRTGRDVATLPKLTVSGHGRASVAQSKAPGRPRRLRRTRPDDAGLA